MTYYFDASANAAPYTIKEAQANVPLCGTDLAAISGGGKMAEVWGIAGGAQLGLAVGSCIGGPVGGLIGAPFGAIIGGIGGRIASAFD